MYVVKTPCWLRTLYPSLIWRFNESEKIIYLTFDDGPHETATPFVLDLLLQYNANATFFCIGKNVQLHQTIYNRILAEGHAIGNHTENHTNGWKVGKEKYLQEIQKATQSIQSNLFRPPYGRIKRSQIKSLKKNYSINHTTPKNLLPNNIIMWDVLSGDFDVHLSPEKCCSNVILNAQPGSIIVFHDSAKAWERMSYALPIVLDYFTQQGYRFEKIVIPS